MAIDHEGARRLMAEAMEGALGTDDEKELALHLVGCDECKGIYEGLQQAHPALESIELGYPSTQSIDAAVHRATTVLRGEADPGPHGLTEEPPRLPDMPEAPTVRIDSGGTHTDEEVIVPAGPSTSTGPLPVTPPPVPSGSLGPSTPIRTPAFAMDVPEAHVRPILPDTAPEPEAEPAPEPEEPEPDVPSPGVPEHLLEADVRPVAPELPLELELPPVPVPDVPREPITVGVTPPSAPAERPRSEIESLLDEDRARFEPLPEVTTVEEEDERPTGPGLWFLAIAVTAILFVLTVLLITRGPGLFGGAGGDLPSSDEVRTNVVRAVREMKSLKAGFEIQKLDLYRAGREGDSLVYNFANGTFTGRIVYDRAEGYKQDFALTVRDDERERAEIVQTADETQSLIGTGNDRRLLVEQNPPLGPPDGSLRPELGLLEQSLSTAAALIASSEDLVVAGKTELDGRELYKIRGTVRADDLSRADLVEANLDANNFLPVIVKRSIAKENADVLGPPSALDQTAIDRAFAQNERVTTEYLELSNVTYDDIVLPNELILDVPNGVDTQRSNSKFERLTHAELTTELDYQPLLPRSLPNGFEEELLAEYTGEPRNWGPNRTLPKPKHVFHSAYFDGRTTIVVTQREMSARFKLDTSPLAGAGLPVTVERISRDDKEFFYGFSPEVPPHVYGFIGNTFVMASGYATRDQLVDVVASLAETPAAVPGATDGSAEPSGSSAATASPSGSPSGSPPATSSPAATATP
jgi:hypothetical protein